MFTAAAYFAFLHFHIAYYSYYVSHVTDLHLFSLPLNKFNEGASTFHVVKEYLLICQTFQDPLRINCTQLWHL